MKVGILSMQQITNYGSFLQAYGLKSIIEGLGHEVKFINIRSGRQLPQYKLSKLHKIRLMLSRLKVKHPLRQLSCTLRLHRRFDQEFKPELGVTDKSQTEEFDIVVIGSDEVFNVAQTTWFGFSRQLFGEGLNAKKVISYAGCFGATTLDILHELGIYDEVRELISKLNALSVRDRNSMDVVKGLIGQYPTLNVDPVIAYDFDKEIRLPKVNEDYLLIYTYPGRMNDPAEVEAITSFAEKHMLKTVAIANYFDWVDEVVTPHPFEVLGYFKCAKYIVTDTFHGAVMSLKYNRPFSVIVRNMNSNKLTFLLEQFNLSSKIAMSAEMIKDILLSPNEYSEVNQKIADEKQSTTRYLINELR